MIDPEGTKMGRLIETCQHGQVLGWSCHKCRSGGRRTEPRQYRLADFIWCSHEPLYAAASMLAIAMRDEVVGATAQKALERLTAVLNAPDDRPAIVTTRHSAPDGAAAAETKP